MCYRLAADLSDRIAAIAPISGTMALANHEPNHPVSVMHFHGTADLFLPFNGSPEIATTVVAMASVDQTVKRWVKADGCPREPVIAALPDKAHDGTKVVKKTYGPGKDGTEVVLVAIEGGGHAWPGRPLPLLGKATKNVSAADLMWEFFQKHPKK